MTSELPAEWRQVGLLQSSLWANQPWDADVVAALLVLADHMDVRLTPELAKAALLDLSAEGGERASFAPNPGLVVERALQIIARNRPALPPPPMPDDNAVVAERLAAWAERQSPERLAAWADFRDRLKRVRPEERAGVIADWLAQAPWGPRDVEQVPGPTIPPPPPPGPAEPTPEVLRHLEGYLRDGKEHLIAPRYRHLVPPIKRRLERERKRERKGVA